MEINKNNQGDSLDQPNLETSKGRWRTRQESSNSWTRIHSPECTMKPGGLTACYLNHRVKAVMTHC